MTVHKNIHLNEVEADFTLEFNVKLNMVNSNFKTLNISKTDANFEQERGYFQKSYGNRCFKEIKKKMRCNWIKDFTFTGRSGGWFTLLCEDKDINKITDEQFEKLSKIVEMYLKNYYRELEIYYDID